jgi:hypothetical protein
MTIALWAVLFIILIFTVFEAYVLWPRKEKVNKEIDLSPGAINYTGPPRIGLVLRELSILAKLNKHIELHYHKRVDRFVIELSLRDIWEIMMCIEVVNHQFNEFKALAEGDLSRIVYHGAILVKEKGGYPKIEEITR